MNSQEARKLLEQAVILSGDIGRIGLTETERNRVGLALEGIGLRRIARVEGTSDGSVARSLKHAAVRARNYINGDWSPED